MSNLEQMMEIDRAISFKLTKVSDALHLCTWAHACRAILRPLYRL